MNENRQQWEPSGLERFSHLEDKIFRMVEEFKTVRKDNENLRTENGRLKEEMQKLQADADAARENLVQFQNEREQLRDRVEKALNLLATLEANK